MCTMRLFIGSPFRLIYQPAARLRGVGDLGRQREVDVLLDEAGLRDGRAAALEETYRIAPQPLGRGGAGGDAYALDAYEPFGIELANVVDEMGRHALGARDLAEQIGRA